MIFRIIFCISILILFLCVEIFFVNKNIQTKHIRSEVCFDTINNC